MSDNSKIGFPAVCLTLSIKVCLLVSFKSKSNTGESLSGNPSSIGGICPGSFFDCYFKKRSN